MQLKIFTMVIGLLVAFVSRKMTKKWRKVSLVTTLGLLILNRIVMTRG